MGLTDYKLYDKVSNKLRTWVFPKEWPQTGAERLKAANVTTAKLLPYITALTNLLNGRPDLQNGYIIRPAFQHWDSYLQKEFVGRFVIWLQQMNPIPEPIFYATYNLQNNRLTQYWQFNRDVIQQNFQFGHKGAFLGVPRVFCVYMGSPLTTIQPRIIGGQPHLVICTPADVITYGP